jgi:hypothetical protein
MDYMLGVVLELRTPPVEGRNERSMYRKHMDYLLDIKLDLTPFEDSSVEGVCNKWITC